jgi:MFS transporter
MGKHRDILADVRSQLPAANFFSFFAIALIEFSIPYISVVEFGANSIVVACLGVCRFAPQVLLSGLSAHLVGKHDQRSILVMSELFRIIAFLTIASATFLSSELSLAFFCISSFLMGFSSILTAVSISVVVPKVAEGRRRATLFSHLNIAESSADGLGPFLGGVLLGAIGTSLTFSLSALFTAAVLYIFFRFPQLNVSNDLQNDLSLRSRPKLERFLFDVRLNFSSKALSAITIWALVYNFGQSIIESVLLIAITEDFNLSAHAFGVIKGSAVLFAVVGAYLGAKLRAPLYGGMGISIFGFLALMSYFFLAIGAFLHGLPSLVLVFIAFAIDELSSGIVLILVQTFRANIFSDDIRASATASYRSINMIATPLGFLIGGCSGYFFTAENVVMISSVLMIIFGSIILSSSVRLLKL